MRRAVLFALGAVLAGCGYVGDPLPPALNIPKSISDLQVVEHAGDLVVTFTPPERSTEDLPLKQPPEMEIYAGPIVEPFNADTWVAGATRVTNKFPAKDWIGKKIVVSVRSRNTHGKASAWSNFVVLTVIPPLSRPAAWSLEGVPQGVKISAPENTQSFRVYRKAEKEPEERAIAGAPGREYVDSTVAFGERYTYRIQATAPAGDGAAESDISEAKSILYKDTFPPAPPTGLNAIPGVNSIELAWDINREPDFKAFQVYRALESGEFTRTGDLQPNPSFRDTAVVSGKRYRYRITAIDQAGNESAPGEIVEVTAP